jgi:hypothetical protein
MNMLDAQNAHNVSSNNNCVQDAQWRLRDALKLARQRLSDTDPAPSYVVKAVKDLRSWL